MAAYLIGQMTIHDRDRYMEYREQFFPIFERFGGELVAFDDDPTVLEGHLEPGRLVVLRFADKASALKWYNSEDYQRISEVRKAGVTQHFIAVMGERPEVDRFT